MMFIKHFSFIKCHYLFGWYVIPLDLIIATIVPTKILGNNVCYTMAVFITGKTNLNTTQIMV